MLPTRDFDLLGQLATYGGIFGCLLIVFLVIAGLVLLVKYMFATSRYRRSNKQSTPNRR